MDNDIASDWRDHKRERAAKRENNLESSTKMLRDAGVVFVSKNNGLHIVIQTGKGIINFWPSTGLWSHAGTSNRGVKNLIEFIEKLK